MSGTRLRVGVDGHAFSWLAAGVRRYVSQLYAAMLEVAPGIEIVAFGAPDEGLPAGIVRHGAPRFPTNLGWMAASIPLAARGARLDVYHAPAYTAPLWGVHPLVVTIHDVSYERRPEWNVHSNDPARRWFYRKSARVADRILTDSSFSRDEITAAYGIASERIDVVPLAPAASFTPGPFDAAAVPGGVRQPYVLHVGDLHVRRNLATALAAVLSARQGHPACATMSLVCAGVDRGIGSALTEQARQGGAPDAIVLAGAVSDDVLLNLYRGAAALVYPSRYEGFGIPILEAMRCGTPVIGARCASIPEVMGEGGILLEPLDVAAWTRAIVSVVTGEEMAARLSADGRARAAAFSWRLTAERTLAVFEQCAQLPRR